jgi:hypothetical protein
MSYAGGVSCETLHHLIDRIPEGELPAARQFLEYLASKPAHRAALTAPLDDKLVTSGDAEAVAKAREDVRAGPAVSPDNVLGEFGLR